MAGAKDRVFTGLGAHIACLRAPTGLEQNAADNTTGDSKLGSDPWVGNRERNQRR